MQKTYKIIITFKVSVSQKHNYYNPKNVLNYQYLEIIKKKKYKLYLFDVASKNLFTLDNNFLYGDHNTHKVFKKHE